MEEGCLCAVVKPPCGWCTNPEIHKPKRGFARLTEEQRSEIASRGGKKAWALGKAHKFTHEEAKEAGRKGGKVGRRK